MKRRKLITTILVASMLLITACENSSSSDNNKQTVNTVGSGNSKIDTGNNDITVAESKTEKEDNNTITEEINYSLELLTQSEDEEWINRNSIKILDRAYDNEKGNIMFSPISLNIALGVLKEGTKDEILELLDDYLGTDFDSVASDYMNNKVQNYNVGESKLHIANSLWVNSEQKLSDTYKNNTSDKYKATVDSIDVTDVQGSIEKINGWCNEKTEGMIKEIANENNITPETMLLILNSVYFESEWIKPWEVDETSTDIFNAFCGMKEETNLMWSNECNAYYENDKATAFGKSYKNGITFIGILPNEEEEFSVEDLDIPTLLDSERMVNSSLEVRARMPKLDFESKIKLTEILGATYMGKMFDERYDLDGDRGIIDNDVNLHVSDILQKTKIELDEKGTKAAAVTIIDVKNDGLAMPVEKVEIKEVFLDRPFAFIIYDRENEKILFIGKVVTTQ